MNRDEMLDQLRASSDPWDMVIIGGGATGAGTAIEAASRGCRAVLLGQNDCVLVGHGHDAPII